MNKTVGFFAGLALSVAMALPAAAEPATLLGVFGNWSAYSSGTGSSMTCYALSKPRATRPAAKRGAIYLMVSDWPSRKVKAEPQIVYGYPAKEGAAGASLGIGADKFDFFMRNVNKDGSGWLQTLGDNPKLIDSMRGGVTAVAKGLSSRGTHTTDTYSLSGFSDALDKAHSACGM